MTPTSLNRSDTHVLSPGLEPVMRVAAWLSLAHAGLWLLLLIRWVTFGIFDWSAYPFEEALADLPGIVAYLVYGFGLAADLVIGIMLLRGAPAGRTAGLARNITFILFAVIFWFVVREFYAPVFIIGLAGMMLLLLTRQSAWAVNYPAAYFIIVFFVLPNIIVFIISLSERGPRGTVVFPDLAADGLLILFDDYARFFSRISGELIYLRIFWRSVWLALVNTAVCLLFGYPMAYWISRQPLRWRNNLVFLVMIAFWTNFLVRTYAWMLLLRDSGLINNFWTTTFHNAVAGIGANGGLFAWLADVSSEPLPLLFNQGAVFMGLFYGFFPFAVLPIYSNLERLDWSLIEAAADLGASSYQRTVRVLLPLSLPGIVAAAIIVFVPSLGAYVTPALLGGGKVALLGNLIQQQFMTSRDWPFGSAIGFIMMIIMLLAILLYFRVGGERN